MVADPTKKYPGLSALFERHRSGLDTTIDPAPAMAAIKVMLEAIDALVSACGPLAAAEVLEAAFQGIRHAAQRSRKPARPGPAGERGAPPGPRNLVEHHLMLDALTRDAVWSAREGVKTNLRTVARALEADKIVSGTVDTIERQLKRVKRAWEKDNPGKSLAERTTGLENIEIPSGSESRIQRDLERVKKAWEKASAGKPPYNRVRAGLGRVDKPDPQAD